MKKIISLALILAMLLAIMPLTVFATTGTEGLEYILSSDGTYYIVLEYTGTASELVIPSEYEGLPVKEIHGSAFYYCDTLTNIVIPDSITTIGNTAFYGCLNLVSVEIPKSVTDIGFGVVTACLNLTSLTVNEENTVYHSDGNCIIETATKTLVQGCKTSVIPPNGDVERIGYYSFADCLGLNSIVIPDGVKIIDDLSFVDCENLLNVVISDSVTEIGQLAFSGCSALGSIVMPDSVEFIGAWAFEECSSLKDIKIPDSVTIDMYAFYGCDGLTNVVIPDSVTIMDQGVFYACESLTDIYCEAESQPEGWHSDWNDGCSATVHWGYKSEPELTFGDLNGDDTITSADYIVAKRAVMSTYALTEAQIKAGDVNGDGAVTSTDYIMMKRHVMGTYVIGG